MECFWLSGHILQTVQIMAQTVRIMAFLPESLEKPGDFVP